MNCFFLNYYFERKTDCQNGVGCSYRDTDVLCYRDTDAWCQCRCPGALCLASISSSWGALVSCRRPPLLCDSGQLQANTSATPGPLQVSLNGHGQAAELCLERGRTACNFDKTHEHLFISWDDWKTLIKWWHFSATTTWEFLGSLWIAGEEILTFPCPCIARTLLMVLCI